MNPQRPALHHTLLEARAGLELGAWLAALPIMRRKIAGQPHPVLVIPGFFASDTATWPLRHLLHRWGHRALGWELGRNLGAKPGTFDHLLRMIEATAVAADQRVSLIGWSLGGIFARELSRTRPDLVRCVVSLGSPIHGPESSSLAPLFKRLNPRAKAPSPDAQRNRIQSPPVPCTAIYTRSDGIVHWRAALEPAGQRTENIRVLGSHMGLAHNPLALYAIFDRLEQEPENWSRFRWPEAWAR